MEAKGIDIKTTWSYSPLIRDLERWNFFLSPKGEGSKTD